MGLPRCSLAPNYHRTAGTFALSLLAILSFNRLEAVVCQRERSFVSEDSFYSSQLDFQNKREKRSAWKHDISVNRCSNVCMKISSATESKSPTVAGTTHFQVSPTFWVQCTGLYDPLSFPAMLSRRFNTSFEVLKFTMKIKTRRCSYAPATRFSPRHSRKDRYLA
jgi:hypothetical protein